MFRILHISDVHIGKTYKDSESIACKIASDISYNGLSKINCIIVTGDIFDGQVAVTDSLQKEAVNFFEVLLFEINSNQPDNPLSKEDVLFSPGNHDLIRVDDDERKWSKYHTFLNLFYGTIPSFYDAVNYSVLKEYANAKIAFVGLNSCNIMKKKLFDDNYIKKIDKMSENDLFDKNGIDKSKVVEILKSDTTTEYDDYGYIPLRQMTSIERKVKQMDNYVIVAFFHHHFYLFPELLEQVGDSSLVRNYTEVLQHLRYMNVGVVLHGHKHLALERPSITDEYYEAADNIIDVFAGGSVGTDRKDEHTFAVLDLYEKKSEVKLKHYKFIYNGENLAPILLKQVPPKQRAGTIVKILDLLKTIDGEKYLKYESYAERCHKSYDSVCKIISWISQIVTGFSEVNKHFERDVNTLLFVLYAVNYRCIQYMRLVGKEHSYFETTANIWRDFYKNLQLDSELAIAEEEYHKLFKNRRLRDVAATCDMIFSKCENKKSQIYLAFSMLGIYFTDIYLVLTMYADDFKESIEHKINIKIDENTFHENVPAPRIVVASDVDRRSVYIELLCNDATAHKMAVLFVKEFDLLINKFEDYFKIIGLKTYYVLPKVNKNITQNTLDNYNFEAYIPTLIPLLTGDNIYSSKVAFSRELIQNAIDAISVREAKDKRDFSKKIDIELKTDDDGKRYFKISDCGTGMDRFKIERYFTSIGRSFYSGNEYEDLNISYKPISSFGIGFLSSFMVCKEIDVRTKYYIEPSESLKLHIPNYDGCFFIEIDSENRIGTEQKLYLDDRVDEKNIVDYIRKVMQDVKYDIVIQQNNQRDILIPKHSIRMQNDDEKFVFFIPFSEDGEVNIIDYEREIITKKYLQQYEYGFLIRKKRNMQSNGRNMILNSGILVEKASLDTVFDKNFRRKDLWNNPYEIDGSSNEYIVNFPANWLQLDVARENVTEFSDVIKEKTRRQKARSISVLIAKSICSQVQQFITYYENTNTDIPAICLQELLNYALEFCGKQSSEDALRSQIENMKYKIHVIFSEKGICYRIFRDSNCEERVKISYTDSAAKEIRMQIRKTLNKHEQGLYEYANKNIRFSSGMKTLSRNALRLFEEAIYRKEVDLNDKTYLKLNYYINNTKIVAKKEEHEKTIFMILALVLMCTPDETLFSLTHQANEIINVLEVACLNTFCIGKERDGEIRVSYEEFFFRQSISLGEDSVY